MPTCPCWQQPAYLDYAEDAGVLHILTLSLCLQCFDAVGWAPACKKTEWWGAGVVICLERGADLHMAQLMPLPLTVSCLSKNQIGFTFLVPAHLGSTGQRAVKRVCVCVSVPYLSAETNTTETHNHTSKSSGNFSVCISGLQLTQKVISETFFPANLLAYY